MTQRVQVGFAAFVSKYSAGKSGAFSAGETGLNAAPSALGGYAAAFNGTQLFLRGIVESFGANGMNGLLQNALSKIKAILHV